MKKSLRPIKRFTDHREPVAVSVAKGIVLGAVLIALAALTGCTGYPVAIRVQGNHGVYGYSSKGGVTIESSFK